MAQPMTEPPIRHPNKPELPLKVSPRRSDGWIPRIFRKIRLGMFGDDEELLIDNQSEISWRLYHNYHELGLLPPGQQNTYRLRKHGTLGICPTLERNGTEYLVLPLNRQVHRVRIYRQQFGTDTVLYAMSSV